jgi:hypothetical protein
MSSGREEVRVGREEMRWLCPPFPICLTFPWPARHFKLAARQVGPKAAFQLGQTSRRVAPKSPAMAGVAHSQSRSGPASFGSTCDGGGGQLFAAR